MVGSAKACQKVEATDEITNYAPALNIPLLKQI